MTVQSGLLGAALIAISDDLPAATELRSRLGEEQEQLDRANGQFREISPIEELLPLRFDLNVKPTTELTATQVLLHLGYDKPTRAQQLEAGAALKNLNVSHRLLRGNTVYKLPLPKIGQGY